MTGLCKDCRYFQRHWFGHTKAWYGDREAPPQLPNGRGVCTSAKVLSDSSIGWMSDSPCHFGSECQHNHFDSTVNRDADDCLMADCDEDRGSLTVGPNFGCIHFTGGPK